MANMDHIIEPDRQGIWIAATFIVALLRGHLHKIALKSVRCGCAKTLRNRW